MTELVTIAQVRTKSGAPVTLIDNEEVQNTINDVTKEALNYWNVYTTPTKVLEIRDGNGKNQIRVQKPYIWKLLEFQTRINTSESNTIDINDTTIDPISSIITINSFARYSFLMYRHHNSVRLKYLSAFMEKTTKITETTSDIDIGTSVDIPVDDDIYSVNDWVLIEGLDGKREAAKVTAIDTNEITVDSLLQSHEEGSLITKLQTNESLRQYILYASSVAVAVNAIGGTYQLATGYTMEGVQAQIGVAWTHWKNNLDANEKRRKEAKSRVQSKLNSIS